MVRHSSQLKELEKLSRLIRYFILVSTTEAGSGHPTSSLSATDLMTVLLFGGVFKFQVDDPGYPNNDRLIFSKGHAAPLLYSLWAAAKSDLAAAGQITENEILSLRKFGSRLEGHPTMAFPYAEAATGSLGQGLSIGVGMALNAKYVDKLPYRTYVLLGDSEMSEGSQWEAIQLAAHYGLDNLVGILDVNRLGQRGETMYGYDLEAYAKRISAFGWETILISDGHDLSQIQEAFGRALRVQGRPVMIIAKTVKGKGVSFLENKDGWHGKALPADDLKRALVELGEVDKAVRGEIVEPEKVQIPNSSDKVESLPMESRIPDSIGTRPSRDNFQFLNPEGSSQGGTNGAGKSKIQNSRFQTLDYDKMKPVATRKAYGNALVRIFPEFPNIVVLDAEVSNSTFSEMFKAKYPERFFEMFIAEQNMVGTALGFSRRGKIPFVSSFAAFLTRAFDQIRMSQYSDANIKFVGSHAGVSIGEDGASQMGLEDIAMFRTILGGVVLYPSDAISTEKLVEEAAKHRGIVYLRTTRKDTPIIYNEEEAFPIGGSKVLRQSRSDQVTIVAAGITLFEALAAYEELAKEGLYVRVVDLYSIKPVDIDTLRAAAKETRAIVTVEDHFAEGGLGEAVSSALANVQSRIEILAVRKMPQSGKPDELLDYEDISRKAIVKQVKEVLNR